MDYKEDIINYRLSETLISMIKSPVLLVSLDQYQHPYQVITCNQEACEYFNLNPQKIEGMEVGKLKSSDFEVVPWKNVVATQNEDILGYTVAGQGTRGFTRYYMVTNRPTFLDKDKYAFIALFDITKDVVKDHALLVQHQMQKIIGDLLSLTSLDKNLEEILDIILSKIVSVNWTSLENKGCIFIYNQEKERLVMAVQKNIDDDVLSVCSEVPLGKCLCGVAGRSKEIYFTNHLDALHVVKTKGMTEHGHCCVPILSSNEDLLGVLNLYVKYNHHFNQEEIFFLQSVARVIAIVLRYKMEHNKNEELKKQIFMATKMASLGELAAGVAHEINNPLMVIKGNLERLKDDMQNDNHPKLAEHMAILNAQEKSISTIISIASGLKGYARTKEASDTPINVHQVIMETINLIRYIYKRDGIEFDVRLQANNHYVNSTYSKLQQIFMNLFSNSRDALSVAKRKIITIQTKNQADHLILKVADSGHGIKKENRKRVFDKYFTTKDIGKGTGLGMGIVLSIVQSMDAKVSLASKLGVGTIFSFVFAVTHKIDKRLIDQNNKISVTKLKGKVLVVDDSLELLEIISFYLTKLGLVVSQSKSPKEAIHLLEHAQYDYLITDLKMDEMGGIELAQEIRACGFKDVKIIVISADIDALNKLNEQREKYHNAFLQKPFNKEQLFEVLMSLK